MRRRTPADKARPPATELAFTASPFGGHYNHLRRARAGTGGTDEGSYRDDAGRIDGGAGNADGGVTRRVRRADGFLCSLAVTPAGFINSLVRGGVPVKVRRCCFI